MNAHHANPSAVPAELLERATREFRTFQRLTSKARALQASGKHDAAVVAAEIAATYAAFRNPGLFASYDLEHLLLNIGASRVNDRLGRTFKETPERILHVATRALPVGGHTRLTARWITQDTSRVHSFALTNQGGEPIPKFIIDAVHQSGGSVERLSDSPSGPIGWAKRLRRLAGSADAVVLYTFPYDSLPTLAFADKTGMPPIMFVDQADHEFWLGALVSDVVVSLRRTGQVLAHERRSISSDRSFLLPIPLEPAMRRETREQAKIRVGLRADQTLVLSVARGQKYRKFKGEPFFAPLLPVLERHPDSVLVIIGPVEDEEWAFARGVTGGRIMAVGPQSDPSNYFEAADIYLDSFPINSITSMLEAGSFGMPVVTRNAFGPDSRVLGADAPGLDDCVVRVRDVTELQARLSELIGNPILREGVGERTRQSILDVHTGQGWMSSLENLYTVAASAARRSERPVIADDQQFEELDSNWSSVYRRGESLAEIVTLHMRKFPIDMRVRLFASLLARRHPMSLDRLLPEWTVGHLRRLKPRIPF